MKKFFWGTIVVLAVVTVALQVAGSKNIAKDAAATARTKQIGTLASQFEEWLTQAPDTATQQVLSSIDEKLELAFQPVYERIEAYTNFHYSIRGEYTELVVAATGSLETDLEKRLFPDLSERLERIPAELDQEFIATYEKELVSRTQAMVGSVDLGEAMQKATRDAIQRVQVTAPLTAVTSVAGVASIKLISKAVAKKVAGKVLAKAAAKGLIKGGSVLGGMGTGALVCAPAGALTVGLVPAGCAIAGGIITWLVVDGAVIGLDKVLNRDEFEQNLRNSVDFEKERIGEVMKKGLQVKQNELQRMAPQQAQDMTLNQLSQAQRTQICDLAAALLHNYHSIQTTLSARSPESLAAFSVDLDQAAQGETLRAMANDMRANIVAGTRKVKLESLTLTGNFRTEMRANRKVSAIIRVQGNWIEFPRSKATKIEGFRLTTSRTTNIDTNQNVDISAAVEQHLLLKNRFFGGKASATNPLGALSDPSGLLGNFVITLPISHDVDADSLDSVTAKPGQTALLTVTMALSGEKLRDPIPFSNCSVE